MTKHRIHYMKGLACLLLSLAIACSLEAQTAKSGKKKNPFNKGALPLPAKPAKPQPVTPTLPPDNLLDQLRRQQAKAQGSKQKTRKTTSRVSVETALTNGNNALLIEQDYIQARRWYLIAAKQGNDEAQAMMGNLLSEGLGGKQDKSKAFYWYSKAAEQGHAGAQCALGVCYYLGEGTQIDYEKAVHWFQKSAYNNKPQGQFMMGLCYARGIGVKQDLSMARVYLQMASKGGVTQAQELLDQLNN